MYTALIIHLPRTQPADYFSRLLAFLRSNTLSSTGLLILLSVELQLVLVHFGEIGVSIDVEKDTSSTHNGNTNESQNSGSVDNVGDTDAKGKFRHFGYNGFERIVMLCEMLDKICARDHSVGLHS